MRANINSALGVNSRANLNPNQVDQLRSLQAEQDRLERANPSAAPVPVLGTPDIQTARALNTNNNNRSGRLPAYPDNGSDYIDRNTGVAGMAAVPPISSDYRGVDQERLTPESTMGDVASVLQEPYVSTPRRAVTGEINPNTGDNIVNQFVPADFATKQQEAISSMVDPTLGNKGIGGMNADQFTGNILDAYAASNAANIPKKIADPVQRKRVASDTASTLSTLAGKTSDMMWDVQPTVSQFPGQVGQANVRSPASTILSEDGLDDADIADNKDAINYAVASALGLAIHTAPSAKETEAVAGDVPPGDDALTLTQMTSMIHGQLKDTMKALGLNVSNDAVHKLAELATAGSVQAGLISRVSRDGTPFYAPSKNMSDMVRSLVPLYGALAQNEKRRRSSWDVPTGGATFFEPGFKISKGSRYDTGANYRAANLTKSILGHVAEYINEDAFQGITNMFSDVMSNRTEEGYSTSIFAKQFKVDEAAYMSLKKRVDPATSYKDSFTGNEKPYNPKDPNHARIVEDQRVAHAREAIADKMSMIAYYLGAAKDSMGHMLYTEYSHAVANHRLVRNNYDTDIYGSKDVIRNVLSFGYKSTILPSMITDQSEIDKLKVHSRRVFSLMGEARHKALMQLTPAQRAGLGLMELAVLNDSTATGPNIDNKIAKMSSRSIIEGYTPEIGKRMAELGKQYDAWLKNPSTANRDFIETLAGIPRGEYQGSANLWHDFYKIYTAVSPTYIELTAHNYDDGNQNGIMLQALYSGDINTAVALGSTNPNQQDMRNKLFSEMQDNLEDFIKDNPQKLQAWFDFFEGMKTRLGDSAISELLKVPLMQHGYTKSASMFLEHVLDVLESPSFSPLVDDFLRTAYGANVGTATIAEDLNKSLEAGLTSVVDSGLGRMMGKLGHLHAVVNSIPQHKGVAGDTSTYGRFGVILDHDPSVPNNRVIAESQGRRFVNRLPEKTSIYGEGMDKTIDIPHGVSQRDPSARKPARTFWSESKQEHSVYVEPLGSGLRRQTSVLPVQMTDADLLKLMIIKVNDGLELPMPLATVHDAVITPVGSMHVYRNAYNNVAIPMAIPGIQAFAQRMLDSYGDAREKALKKAKLLEQSYGVQYQGTDKADGAIGIGAKGDFPVIGAVFDDLVDKLASESYKNVFKPSKKRTAEQAYNSWRDGATHLVEEAKRLGWLPKQASVAVNYKQFEELLRLVETTDDILSITKSGDSYSAKGRLGDFVSGFAASVSNGWKEIVSNQFISREGLNQMSTSGAGGAPRRGYVKDLEHQANKAKTLTPVKQPEATVPVPPITAAQHFNGFEGEAPF